MKKFTKWRPVKRIKNDIAYWLIRFVVGFFRMIPRSPALAIGETLGRLAPFIVRKDYRRIIEHLTIAFGNEKSSAEIEAIARRIYPNIFKNFVDAARIIVMSDKEVLSVCVSDSFEKLKEPLAAGKGVIALSAHAGSWEFIGPYLTAQKVPTAEVSKELYDPRLEQMLLETRTHNGIVNISRGSNTRDIIRVLKEGYLIGLLIDQDTKVKGVFVDFFGKAAHTATAPAVLSLKFGAPIVPLFTWRDEKDCHHMCFGDPLVIEPSGDSEKDIYELTRQCSIATEAFIREHPDQWVWFHRRWKTRPPEKGATSGEGN